MTDAHDLIADKRRRTKRWMVLGVLLGAGAVAGWSALRWKRRKDAVASCGARFATLQRCLLGGDTLPLDLHEELRARWLGQGPAGGSPEQLATLIRDDVARGSRLVKTQGIAGGR